MERNRDNFEDFGSEEPIFPGDNTPEFSHDQSGRPAPVGPEWFDRNWLRANGAATNEAGDVVRVGSAVLVLLASPAELAIPGQELDQSLRSRGMLSWTRRRPSRAGTLMEQLTRAEANRKAWIEANPFAVFWAATAIAKVTSGRRRRPPRRG
jgi:hypothetical protein